MLMPELVTGLLKTGSGRYWDMTAWVEVQLRRKRCFALRSEPEPEPEPELLPAIVLNLVFGLGSEIEALVLVWSWT